MLKIFIFFIVFSFKAGMLHSLFNEKLKNYQYPATVLFITRDLNVNFLQQSFDNENVFVYWSDRLSNFNFFYQNNWQRVIVLKASISNQNIKDLADCEHFDIVVVDDFDKFSLNFLDNFCDLGSYLILVSKKRKLVESYLKKRRFLYQVFDKDGRIFFIVSTLKSVLKKGWWRSQSTHKNYCVRCNFNNKSIVKNVGSDANGVAKEYVWFAGINLYTFHHLKGVYPKRMFIRESVIEAFNPYTHKDFGAANILIQGKKLKLIDYDDTCYSEDPYIRLDRTLTCQLGLKYK